MIGYIYLTTNLLNNRKYIGQHQSEEFDSNYYGSGKILLHAIKTYGIENFKCEILCECNTIDELNTQEALLIEKHNAVNSKEYYNLKPGGVGKSVSGVVYITNGTSNKKVFPEELDHYFSLGYHLGGPKPTEETIRKRAASNTGKKHPTAGPNISKSLMGKKLSDAHRKKLSDVKKGKPLYWCRCRVRCVETDEVFDSLHIAASSKNVSVGNICSCLKGQRRTAGGFHWQYID